MFSMSVLQSFFITPVELSTLLVLQYIFQDFESLTVKYTTITLNCLVWKFSGKAQFPHSFEPSAPSNKISTPGNQVKLRSFLQCLTVIKNFHFSKKMLLLYYFSIQLLNLLSYFGQGFLKVFQMNFCLSDIELYLHCLICLIL